MREAKAMWTVSITSTKYANDKLASLSVESPANLHNHEGFGLLVGLWCGRLHDRIKIEEGWLEFAVGFQIGDIIVEPTGGKISNRGRLQTTGGHLKVITSETDQSKKHGSVGGQFGINLTRWIGSLAKADINAGGKLDRTISQSEQKNREVVQKFWRVADAGYNFWKVYGLDLNQDNVLEHKIIGDEPLCHIVPEQKSNSIDIEVTFRCQQVDAEPCVRRRGRQVNIQCRKRARPQPSRLGNQSGCRRQKRYPICRGEA